MIKYIILLPLFFCSERIVMTPKKKTAISTTLKMERKLIKVDNTPVNASNGNSNSGGSSATPGRKDSLHIAGGKNAGIVVNKEIDKDGINILITAKNYLPNNWHKIRYCHFP